MPAGRLHFVKFESSRVEDAIQFIEAKGLHRCKGSSGHMRVKATGALGERGAGGGDNVRLGVQTHVGRAAASVS